MQHHHLEHHRRRPEPFEIVGHAPFLAAIMGWDEPKRSADFERAIGAHMAGNRDIEVLVGDERKAAVIIAWEAGGQIGNMTYRLKFQPVVKLEPRDFAKDADYGFQRGRLRYDPAIAAAYPSDPWVKVGTTTIDGTIVEIANMLDVSSWPIDWDRDAEAAIDLFVKSSDPWLIGGRHLLARGSHINGHLGTALIRCDIVRRLSECCLYCDHEHLTPDQLELANECVACSASIEAKMSTQASARRACPECGPHGNAGVVPGFDIAYPCTLCAGGRPGDVHEVKHDESTSWAPFERDFVDVNVAQPRASIAVKSNANPAMDALSRYQDAIAGITIPNTPHIPMTFDPPGHKPGEGFAVPIGTRVSGPHGRVGTVIPFDGYTPYENGVRIKMDSGWIGIYDRSDITIIS